MHATLVLWYFLYANSNTTQAPSMQTPKTVIDLTEIQIEGKIKKPTLFYTISRQHVSFLSHELTSIPLPDYLFTLTQHL